MDAGENGALDAGAVVQRELQKLLGLLYGLAGEDLNGTEIGLREGLKVDNVCK